MAAASRLDVAGYLDRLGLPAQGPPSVGSLRRLHRAHVERVPYENLEIQLRRRTTIDPFESAERIVRLRRGGYCYHLNGAFSALLDALGFRVTRHVGGVQRTDRDPVGATGGHMALTVAGLPDETCPAGVWMVDVGLGAILYEPVPLDEGTYRQGPFEYRLRPSDAVPDGWRLDNDPKGSFVGMDFHTLPAQLGDFAPMHEHLSTASDSPFVRVAVVQRRHAAGADVLRGRVLTRVASEAADETLLQSEADWYEALADVFGLPLDDVGTAERTQLWDRIDAAHREFEHSRSV